MYTYQIKVVKTRHQKTSKIDLDVALSFQCRLCLPNPTFLESDHPCIQLEKPATQS